MDFEAGRRTDPPPRVQAGFPLKRTCNLRTWNSSYRRSLRIQGAGCLRRRIVLLHV
jgi:hypothetical protein